MAVALARCLLLTLCSEFHGFQITSNFSADRISSSLIEIKAALAAMNASLTDKKRTGNGKYKATNAALYKLSGKVDEVERSGLVLFSQKTAEDLFSVVLEAQDSVQDEKSKTSKSVPRAWSRIRTLADALMETRFGPSWAAQVSLTLRAKNLLELTQAATLEFRSERERTKNLWKAFAENVCKLKLFEDQVGLFAKKRDTKIFVSLEVLSLQLLEEGKTSDFLQSVRTAVRRLNEAAGEISPDDLKDVTSFAVVRPTLVRDREIDVDSDKARMRISAAVCAMVRTEFLPRSHSKIVRRGTMMLFENPEKPQFFLHGGVTDPRAWASELHLPLWTSSVINGDEKCVAWPASYSNPNRNVGVREIERFDFRRSRSEGYISVWERTKNCDFLFCSKKICFSNLSLRNVNVSPLQSPLRGDGVDAQKISSEFTSVIARIKHAGPGVDSYIFSSKMKQSCGLKLRKVVSLRNPTRAELEDPKVSMSEDSAEEMVLNKANNYGLRDAYDR